MTCPDCQRSAAACERATRTIASLRAENEHLVNVAMGTAMALGMLTGGLAQMRDDICAYADDTLWIGEAETVVDRIHFLLGEEEVPS